MQIVINGRRREVSDAASVEQVVATISTSLQGIAVAVNGEIVRRASWPAVTLKAGDDVEVLTAVQGG